MKELAISHPTHLRLNTSLLAASEKRLLIWIAERLPRWVHSDHLSALGVIDLAGTAPIVRPFGLFEVRLFDLEGIFGIAGMATTFVITSGVNAHALYLPETTRR